MPALIPRPDTLLARPKTIAEVLSPMEGAEVEFWTPRMEPRAEGIVGVFRGGRFWSSDMADHWMPSEVGTWQPRAVAGSR